MRVGDSWRKLASSDLVVLLLLATAGALLGGTTSMTVASSATCVPRMRAARRAEQVLLDATNTTHGWPRDLGSRIALGSGVLSRFRLLRVERERKNLETSISFDVLRSH
jgi:hypothetical protein